MSQAAHRTPKLTYQDYLQLPDDGKIHEIIDGDHYMSPAPETDHQTVSRWIQFQLFEQIEKVGTGRVFNAPTDVELTETDVVQPDLVIVAYARREIITRRRILGIPDLLVEVLSPSRPEYDLDLKLHLYERCAVPDYWIADPENRILDRYQLSESGHYDTPSRHTETVSYAAGAMHATVDLTQVWKALRGM
jgi:Uma2 family endonuclease